MVSRFLYPTSSSAPAAAGALLFFYSDQSGGDQRQIASGHDVTVGIQTVRIDEVTARAAKLGGLVVHHLGEALLRPADIFCQHVGGIVGRLHERGVHHVLQRHFFAGNQRNIGGVALDVDRRFGHGNTVYNRRKAD